ncbi:MAG: PfkB family carbohydrate kinase, partial [Nitrospinaceae bacterium]
MRLSTPLGTVLVMGEVLFDVFPDGPRLGGASFNFACHLHRLGIPVRFISRVGNDKAGRDILDFARNWGFPTEGIQTDQEHATGEVKVVMTPDGGHDFEIMPDRAFDYIEMNPHLDALLAEEISCVYFGTLIQRHAVSRGTLQTLTKRLRARSRFIVDLNLRAPFFSRELIEETLHAADLLKVSAEELDQLRDLFKEKDTRSRFPETLLRKFRLGNLCVTRGSNGCVWYEVGQEKPTLAASVPCAEFADAVGAGDGFAAMMTAGLLAGLPRQTVLELACHFASRICAVQGALPAAPAFYQPFRFE